MKMSYYLFNRQELLQKTKERYHNGGDEKESTEYCPANKDALKEKAKSRYRNDEKKEAKRKFGQSRYKGMRTS